jgi:hypothetical protein
MNLKTLNQATENTEFTEKPVVEPPEKALRKMKRAVVECSAFSVVSVAN